MKQKYGVELTYSIQMLHYLHYTNHIIMLCYFNVINSLTG